MADSLAIAGGMETPSIDAAFKWKGINGKVGGVLTLGVLPSNGRIFVPTSLFASIPQGAGITVFPVISIGTNSPNWDNIIPAFTLPAAAVGKVVALPFGASWAWINAGQTASLNIQTPGAAPGVITLAILAKGDWL